MKAKTIKNVINMKLKDWLDSIECEETKKLAKKNTIVTGGSIASMLLNETVNDFDIYFRNRETALAVAKYYVAAFKQKLESGIECPIYIDDREERIKIVIKSSGIASEEGSNSDYEYFEQSENTDNQQQYVSEIISNSSSIEEKYEEIEDNALAVENEEGKKKYRPVFLSTNAITLSGKIQIVIRFFGEPDEIHENYDFVHCTNYFDLGENKLCLKQEALEALLARELRYVGSKYPLCSIIRLRKFIKRGWTINAGQILKMAMQLNALDLTDHSVLEDQLTGVDSAYFAQLVKKLSEKDPDKVDQAYLIEIIDRIF